MRYAFYKIVEYEDDCFPLRFQAYDSDGELVKLIRFEGQIYAVMKVEL